MEVNFTIVLKFDIDLFSKYLIIVIKDHSMLFFLLQDNRCNTQQNMVAQGSIISIFVQISLTLYNG
jgi:hypothetical protein